MSPSVDHLYSNLWVWSTCGVITWIRMGLGARSPGPWMITYRLPVCICACPNLHDGPMLPPGSDIPTSSAIPEDALSKCLVCICSEHLPVIILHFCCAPPLLSPHPFKYLGFTTGMVNTAVFWSRLSWL